jgi:putative sterol carrier protein
MVKFLSQEWFDAQTSGASSFPERPGVTARMQYKITGTPDGDVTFHTVIEDGKIVESELGDDPSADFTRTVPYGDFAEISKGELDAEAAFMQGRVKVAGDMGKVLALMPLTQSPEYRTAAEKLDAQTEY